MTINTRATVPPGISAFVAHANCEKIFLAILFEVRSKIIIKSSVTVGMITEIIFIDPHIAVHVYAIEVDRRSFAIALIQPKMFAIPGGASNHISCRSTAHAFGAERAN